MVDVAGGADAVVGSDASGEVVIDYGRTLDAAVEAMRGGRYRDSMLGMARARFVEVMAGEVAQQSRTLGGQIVRLELLEDHVGDFVNGLNDYVVFFELVGPLEVDCVGRDESGVWRVRLAVLIDNGRDESSCGSGKDLSRGPAEVAAELADCVRAWNTLYWAVEELVTDGN